MLAARLTKIELHGNRQNFSRLTEWLYKMTQSYARRVSVLVFINLAAYTHVDFVAAVVYFKVVC